MPNLTIHRDSPAYSFSVRKVTGHFGPKTFRYQDTSARVRTVSGQFGPKTLWHQDISALMRGHFGTTAERRWDSAQACNRETNIKDTQSHHYYTGVHPRSPAMSPLNVGADVPVCRHSSCLHGRHLRSSSYRSFTVPRTRTTFGDRSFTVAGPRLWNSLPATLRQINSYGQFRRHLKTHLFRA